MYQLSKGAFQLYAKCSTALIIFQLLSTFYSQSPMYRGPAHDRDLPSIARPWSALTSKLGPVGFYKGRQVPATGRLTRKGAFEVLEHKRPRYRMPTGLESSELKPYVARDPSFASAKKAG